MRKKVLLDGDRVSGDSRGWYATIGTRHVEALGDVLDCDVWHPKDHPDDPEAHANENVLTTADSIEECLDALRADGWLTTKEPVVTDLPSLS